MRDYASIVLTTLEEAAPDDLAYVRAQLSEDYDEPVHPGLSRRAAALALARAPRDHLRMPPAARITDMHTCPMFDGPKPHVGGPILPPGAPTVLIGGLPAARVGDMCTCVGPPDVIVKGSFKVIIGGKPAARMGDMTAHGGVIVAGYPLVMIN